MDVSEIWNAVLDKAAKSGTDSLSSTERAIYYLNRLVVDLDVGGLTGLLYNMSPNSSGSGWSELHDTIAALQAAGEMEAAGLLGQVAEAVESVPPGPSGTWGEFVAPVKGRLAQLEPQIEEVASRVWDKLEVLAEQLVQEK